MADTGNRSEEASEKKYLHVELTAEQHKDLRLRALYQDKSLSDLVRDTFFGEERKTVHA